MFTTFLPQLGMSPMRDRDSIENQLGKRSEGITDLKKVAIYLLSQCPIYAR